MPQTINDMAVTWANSLTTFSAIKMNVQDNASASGSLLMDLQVGGSSKFSVSKSGVISGVNSGTSTLSPSFGNWTANGEIRSVGLGNTGDLYFGVSRDLILTRRAAASLRLGAADAAAPVAQTLGVQSVVAGTTDTAGANFTIAGSQGTGTGAGGSIIFQVAPAGSSGTAQNALSTALTINSNQVFTFGATPAGTSSTSIGALFYNGGALILGDTSGSGNAVSLYGNIGFGRSLRLDSGLALAWNSGGFGSGADVGLWRDAANTLALRNGANAQAFRVYNTTDGTNLERGFMRWSSNRFEIGAEAAGAGSARPTLLIVQAGSTFLSHFSGGTGLQYNTPLSVPTLYLANAGSGGSYNVSINGEGLLSLTNTGTVLLGDVGFVRSAANVSRVTNGSTGGGSVELQEMTAPAAPATNNVRIYAEDNGSGKTRLMARFATGAAVQIAIEP